MWQCARYHFAKKRDISGKRFGFVHTHSELEGGGIICNAKMDKKLGGGGKICMTINGKTGNRRVDQGDVGMKTQNSVKDKTQHTKSSGGKR